MSRPTCDHRDRHSAQCESPSRRLIRPGGIAFDTVLVFPCQTWTAGWTTPIGLLVLLALAGCKSALAPSAEEARLHAQAKAAQGRQTIADPWVLQARLAANKSKSSKTSDQAKSTQPDLQELSPVITNARPQLADPPAVDAKQPASKATSVDLHQPPSIGKPNSSAPNSPGPNKTSQRHHQPATQTLAVTAKQNRQSSPGTTHRAHHEEWVTETDPVQTEFVTSKARLETDHTTPSQNSNPRLARTEKIEVGDKAPDHSSNIAKKLPGKLPSDLNPPTVKIPTAGKSKTTKVSKSSKSAGSVDTVLSQFESLLKPAISTKAEPNSTTSSEPIAWQEPPANAPARLQLHNVLLCRQVLGFGQVDVYPPQNVSPGKRVLLYTEVQSFSTQQTRKGQLIHLQAQLELRDHTGRLIKTYDFGEIRDVCLAKRRDFFCHFGFTLPDTLSPGDYQLQLHVRDLLSSMQADHLVHVELFQASP